MRKFKNDVSDGWLFKQELRLWRNFARNWDQDVEDCDFFDIFANTTNASRDEAKAIIARVFPVKELDKINVIKFPCGEESRENELELNGDVDQILCDIWNRKGWRDECRSMLVAWSERMEGRRTRNCRLKDPMESRVDELCRVLRLSPTERDVVIYALVRLMTCFDDVPCRSYKGRRDWCRFIAMAVDVPSSEIMTALSDKGRLRRYGVLNSEGYFINSEGDFDCCDNSFREYLERGNDSLLEGRFFQRTDLSGSLPWSYYGKLVEKHGGTLKDLIASAKGRRGANILLYGAPGTGKTSFAKTLAKELGLDLFEIRQGDRDNKHDSPQIRIIGIRLCNEQVPRGQSMILIDEADQLLRTSSSLSSILLGNSSGNGSEKGVINSILDETKLPTVWISNAPAEAMDDSVRRRFDYSICFEELNSRQRQHIWQNVVEKLCLGRMVTPQMIETLADRYPVSAGGISMVLENVKRMKPRKAKVGELIDRLMEPHCELMGGRKTNDNLLPAKDYSLEGLNILGDMDLKNIVEAVKKFREEMDTDIDPDRPRMNLLLWGAPGTGKTEFVKYLGQETGAQVIVKMGSDLLSMYVGGTEANIKQAFAQAEAEEAILFLDEIDGLVQDRSGAMRSWEVTQVNELLHQMENFKGVMVGATNFMDNLDRAIMRRFTFKLQFDYLDEAGKRLFFERMFRTNLTDEEAELLKNVRNLAPGDFRTVRQSMYYLGGSVTNSQRIAALTRESAVKKIATNACRIGFGA